MTQLMDGKSDPLYMVAILIAVLWVLPWKGWALWRAARREEKWWFIALLLVNTLGLLEILYLFVFGKDDHPPVQGIGKDRKEKERGSVTSATSS